MPLDPLPMKGVQLNFALFVIKKLREHTYSVPKSQSLILLSYHRYQTMFAVRITRSFDELKPFFQKIVTSHPDSVLVVFQHDADEEVSRTHIHAAMINVNPSTDTLKRWIKDALDVKSFSRYDWSFKQLEGLDRYVTYMSKGKLEPSFLHNIEYATVTALRSEWKEHPVVEDKREDVTAYSMAIELAKWIDMDIRQSEYDPVQRKWTNVGEDITERDIVIQAIAIHNKYRKGFCDFSLVRVIQTAYGLCSKQRFKDALVAKVLDKLSPRIV